MKFYNFFFAISTILIFLISCTNISNPTKNKVLALVNNKPILPSEIDSIVAVEVYKIKIKALEDLISEKILELEAKSKNITYSELIEKEITNKNPITLKDLEKYIFLNNIVEDVDTNNVMSYLCIPSKNKGIFLILL